MNKSVMPKKMIAYVIVTAKKSCDLNGCNWNAFINVFNKYLQDKKWGYYDGYGREMKTCGEVDVFFFVRSDKINYVKNKIEKLLKAKRLRSKTKFLVVEKLFKPKKIDLKYIRWK